MSNAMGADGNSATGDGCRPARRRFLGQAAGAMALAGAPHVARAAARSVVVVGGGFAGVIAARYLRRWSPALRVTLVESAPRFVSCPMSNRVLSGTMALTDLERDYDRLSRFGIQVVQDAVTAIDTSRREVRLARGASIPFDRCVVAPGVDFMYEQVPGLETDAARDTVPHAWKAGTQTVALRRRIMTMKTGGVFAMHVPKAPYRCPSGPYERATLVAGYLKKFNPRAKVLLFDANPDVQAKRDLFRSYWETHLRDMLTYLPSAELRSVDAASLTLDTDLRGRHTVDVLNVIPPQRAGAIARQATALAPYQDWCGVDFLTYESRDTPRVHVLGDAVAAAPGMPKSGHMANQQAKVAASAIAALLEGRPVNDEPLIANTCYSFVSDREVIHAASVYRYDAGKRTMVNVPGAGGLSPEPSATEGYLALAWLFNILDDMFV